jgi:hypothetical protein
MTSVEASRREIKEGFERRVKLVFQTPGTETH